MQHEVKTAESRKAPKKSLDEIAIKPKMGGGHKVIHRFESYEHQPEEYHFNAEGGREGKGGGEHVLSHIAKHAGLPGLEAYDSDESSETEKEIKA